MVVGHFEGGGSDLTPEFATQKKMEEWIKMPEEEKIKEMQEEEYLLRIRNS